MRKIFSDIETWWHPALTICVSLIPFVQIVAFYSYVLLGLTLLDYWGADILETIELIVPKYNKVMKISYGE